MKKILSSLLVSVVCCTYGYTSEIKYSVAENLGVINYKSSSHIEFIPKDETTPYRLTLFQNNNSTNLKIGPSQYNFVNFGSDGKGKLQMATSSVLENTDFDGDITNFPNELTAKNVFFDFKNDGFIIASNKQSLQNCMLNFQNGGAGVSFRAGSKNAVDINDPSQSPLTNLVNLLLYNHLPKDKASAFHESTNDAKRVIDDIFVSSVNPKGGACPIYSYSNFPANTFVWQVKGAKIALITDEQKFIFIAKE